ncbi:LIM and cysteine-rich domains protein 1 [Bienertia sinuspersici]
MKETKEKEKVCKRCKVSFTPSSNTSFSCRFHPSFFVCRRHDDQKRFFFFYYYYLNYYITSHSD